MISEIGVSMTAFGRCLTSEILVNICLNFGTKFGSCTL